jgi:hypothetical protein
VPRRGRGRREVGQAGVDRGVGLHGRQDPAAGDGGRGLHTLLDHPVHPPLEAGVGWPGGEQGDRLWPGGVRCPGGGVGAGRWARPVWIVGWGFTGARTLRISLA